MDDKEKLEKDASDLDDALNYVSDLNTSLRSLCERNTTPEFTKLKEQGAALEAALSDKLDEADKQINELEHEDED